MALLWLSFGFISALTADSSCSKPLVDCRQEKSILVHQIHSLLGQSTSPFMLFQGVSEEQISKAHQGLEELAKSFSECLTCNSSKQDLALEKEYIDSIINGVYDQICLASSSPCMKGVYESCGFNGHNPKFMETNEFSKCLCSDTFKLTACISKKGCSNRKDIISDFSFLESCRSLGHLNMASSVVNLSTGTLATQTSTLKISTYSLTLETIQSSTSNIENTSMAEYYSAGSKVHLFLSITMMIFSIFL